MRPERVDTLEMRLTLAAISGNSRPTRSVARNNPPEALSFTLTFLNNSAHTITDQ